MPDADPSVYHLAGLAGVFLYLGSYMALQAGLIRAQSFVNPCTHAGAWTDQAMQWIGADRAA